MLVQRVISRDFGLALCSLMASAQQDAIIVAPFIKATAFRRLSDSLPEQVELIVITRWVPQEVAWGASDTSVMDLITERQHAKLLLHPQVHAKVYMIDRKHAIVGSANVTDTALGFSERSNREILIEIEPTPTRLLLFLRQLQREAMPASAEFRSQIEALAARFNGQSVFPDLEVGLVTTPQVKEEWFPSLRNPERLYQLYCSIHDASSQDEYEAALDDLMELSLSDNLGENEFRQNVIDRLNSYKQIRDLNDFIRQPRRFGELTEWLKSRTGQGSIEHSVCQRQIQCLIRWLLHFMPHTYDLKQPHYTEMFGFRDVRNSHN